MALELYKSRYKISPARRMPASSDPEPLPIAKAALCSHAARPEIENVIVKRESTVQDCKERLW